MHFIFLTVDKNRSFKTLNGCSIQQPTLYLCLLTAQCRSSQGWLQERLCFPFRRALSLLDLGMLELLAWWNGIQMVNRKKELFAIAIKKEAHKTYSVLKTQVAPAPNGLNLYLLKVWTSYCYSIQLFSVGYFSQLVSYSVLAWFRSYGIPCRTGNTNPLYGFSL